MFYLQSLVSNACLFLATYLHNVNMDNSFQRQSRKHKEVVHFSQTNVHKRNGRLAAEGVGTRNWKKKHIMARTHIIVSTLVCIQLF